jgi:F-type H+-transporting ATPase subunit b
MPVDAVLLAAEEGQNPLFPAIYDIVWSSVVFVVLLVLFWRYVLPKYLSVLDERTDRIEGGLKRADEAQAEAARLKEQFAAQLAEARADAGRAREEARAEGAAIVAQMRADAQAEAARIVESAQRQVEAERQQAATQLRQEVGRLAVQLAERIVGEALTDDARQQRVIDRFLDDIDEPAAAGAPATGSARAPGGTRARS